MSLKIDYKEKLYESWQKMFFYTENNRLMNLQIYMTTKWFVTCNWHYNFLAFQAY